jgi:hypothetical protein
LENKVNKELSRFIGKGREDKEIETISDFASNKEALQCKSYTQVWCRGIRFIELLGYLRQKDNTQKNMQNKLACFKLLSRNNHSFTIQLRNEEKSTLSAVPVKILKCM